MSTPITESSKTGKTPLTREEVSLMSDEDFLATCKEFKWGGQWESMQAFMYAAGRLGNIQGLVVGK